MKAHSIVIIGAMHGDERIGATVIMALEKILSAQHVHGALNLIIGNPKAYKKRVRFINCDLNRLFGRKKIARGYEAKRAEQLKAILAKADYLLDIHSTIKPSVPFVYCESTEKHLKLARLIDTQFIVSPAKSFRIPELISSADNFVDRHGGIGLTYESGWHKDTNSVKHVLENAKRFLQATGCVNFDKIAPMPTDSQKTQHAKTPRSKTPRHLFIYNKITPKTANFCFRRDFKNFDFAAKDGIIARDGSYKHRAPRNSFIIFPKKDFEIGKTACYLAA